MFQSVETLKGVCVNKRQASGLKGDSVVRVITYIKEYYRIYSLAGCSYRAASLVYATLLSLVPLMIVLFSIFSLFPHMHTVYQDIQSFVFNNFVAQSARVVQGQVTSFVSNVSQLSIVNIVFLAVVCLLMIYNMSCAFNSIWGVDYTANLGMRLLMYILVLVLGPPMVASCLLLFAFFMSLPMIQAVTQHAVLLRFWSWGLPYLITFLIFFMLNWALPATHVKGRYAALGALVTTVLFELAKYGFTRYLSLVPTYRLLYGALASVPIFLLWLYICWLIILLGAIVTAVAQKPLSLSK